jgi:hypothetical protein
MNEKQVSIGQKF